MVLLTSSAVSAALSAGIVCIFTFLLFLSGYVLQQQTVRSLQEAIRNPPEKPWYPKPTLPPQFLEDNDTIKPLAAEDDLAQAATGQRSLQHRVKQKVAIGEDLVSSQNEELVEPSPLQLWHEYIAKPKSDVGSNQGIEDDVYGVESSNKAPQPFGDIGKYAYILTIPTTTDLCSVVLFTQWYRQFSKVSPPPSIVYIYPASWEISDSPIHTGAMDLIREMQDSLGVTCHPVSISRLWTGVSVETQLLSELQRTKWSYDRAMYFRSPGMALDITALDRALITSTLKSSWQGLSSKSTSLTPFLLLYVYENGLLAPRASMRELTVLATTAHGSQQEDEAAVESKYAAYVIFDEKDLQHRRRESFSSSRLFERFERERRNACAATPILTRYDMDDRA